MNNLSIFDTHCHLVDQKYQQYNINEIIQKAEKSGVKYILNVGYDKKTNCRVVEQLAEFSSLFGALGLHPNSREDLKEENLKWIERQLTNKKIIAIGEIGLDYYWEFTSRETQKYWFRKQLKLAKEYKLPVLLHIRGQEEKKEKDNFIEAFNDAYEIVKETKIKKGILHCFTGTWEIAQKFVDLGFYISFAGNITYKNAKWKEKWEEVIEKIPLEKMVVETDAPYLLPAPCSKQQKEINYPKNIVYTLEKIAEIKKMKIEEVAEKIYSNTLRFFGLSQ